MSDDPRSHEPAADNDQERKPEPAPANPPNQNADADVKTDGGVNDPAAK